jgi:hypothetical protein
MRRPKHVTAKARTRASYDRLWMRRVMQKVVRAVFDKVMERLLKMPVTLHREGQPPELIP